MQMHKERGFHSFEFMLEECRRVGGIVETHRFVDCGVTKEVPSNRQYCLSRRDEFPKEKPQSLILVCSRGYSETSIWIWEIITEDKAMWFADGVGDDWKSLMSAWGYRSDDGFEDKNFMVWGH